MIFNEIIYELENEKKIDLLLEKIRHIEIEKNIFSTKTLSITSDEEKFLTEAASVYSYSNNPKHHEKALTIATILPQISDSVGVLTSVLVTLGRLTNFPAIKLLEKWYEQDYKNILRGFALVEAFVFESINSQNFLGKDYSLTKFQKKVVHLVNEGTAISVSAPTSAGKSFIFLRILLQYVSQCTGSTAIYIVPTRALIRQVMNDIYESLMEFNIKNVYVSCSSEVDNLVKFPDRSNILVLTQERLYQLCTSPNVRILDTRIMVVDEAQNIQSEGRGVLLEGAIKQALSIWPKSKVLFSSPLIDNPQKFFETFNLTSESDEKDIFPLVRQNILKVSFAQNELIITELLTDTEIKKIHFSYKCDSVGKTLANVALTLFNDQISIIYSNEPMLSARVARELYNSGKFPELNDERLNEFADFIKEHIHPEYELASFVRCGIAFHFGALPAILRAGIEDLFKIGALRIVCCTSTLLEGLNMPAKNIFIYKPTQGRSKPLNVLNFWNLAGRAGRLGVDFSGNIFCIDPKSWDVNPFEGPRLQTVVPALESRLKKDFEKIYSFINVRDQESGSNDYDEQVVSQIIRERINGFLLSESKYVTERNHEILEKIDSTVRDIMDDFQPPKEIIIQNPGVLPDRINALWDYFKENEKYYYRLKPMYPFDKGAYERFKEIVTNINNFILKGRYSEKQVNRLVVIGQKWMAGNPISDIILYGLKPDAKPSQITSHVKSSVETIEREICFRLVKYLQLYLQLLKMFMEQKGQNVEEERVWSISTYLEYGACTVPALSFMSFGLHRATALVLDKKIGYRPNITADECLYFLRTVDAGNLNISNYLKGQILKVQKTFK